MLSSMPARYSLPRGTRVTVTSGKYAGARAVVESNVYQKSVDYPEEPADGFQVTVPHGDGKETWVTVRWDQVREGW